MISRTMKNCEPDRDGGNGGGRETGERRERDGRETGESECRQKREDGRGGV